MQYVTLLYHELYYELSYHELLYYELYHEDIGDDPFVTNSNDSF